MMSPLSFKRQEGASSRAKPAMHVSTLWKLAIQRPGTSEVVGKVVARIRRSPSLRGGSQTIVDPSSAISPRPWQATTRDGGNAANVPHLRAIFLETTVRPGTLPGHRRTSVLWVTQAPPRAGRARASPRRTRAAPNPTSVDHEEIGFCGTPPPQPAANPSTYGSGPSPAFYSFPTVPAAAARWRSPRTSRLGEGAVREATTGPARMPPSRGAGTDGRSWSACSPTSPSARAAWPCRRCSSPTKQVRAAAVGSFRRLHRRRHGRPSRRTAAPPRRPALPD